MWASGPLLILGTVFALSPRRSRALATVTLPSGAEAARRVARSASVMLVVVAVLLALIPAVFILWPFLRGEGRDEFEYDEHSSRADLTTRWDVAVSGLTSAELDYLLGNLSETDYRSLRSQLMIECSAVMAEMELSEDEEERVLAELTEAVDAVRARVQGG